MTVIRMILVALPALAAAACNDGDASSRRPIESPLPTGQDDRPAGGVRVAGVVTYAGPAPVTEIPFVDVDTDKCGAVPPESFLRNAENQGLQNAVVRVLGVTGAHQGARTIKVGNDRCRFNPHVSVAVVGSRLQITNQDPIAHTTHPYMNGASLFNVPIDPGGAPIERPLNEAGVLKLTCDVHSWMQGWVVVADNPFVAVTDARGRFDIAGVPPGSYQVAVWHEALGEKKMTLVVPATGVTDARLDLSDTKSGSIDGLKPLPLGLDEMATKIPADNPITPAKVELGRVLFFDKHLSKDDSISCATCHDPAKGFSNGLPVATGVGGVQGKRSVPTIINRRFSSAQFWDGRAASLEEQALGPIANPDEMALPIADLVAKLQGDAEYKRMFAAAYGPPDVTAEGIAHAIAAFERTLVSGNSPFDRYEAGDHDALAPDAARGLALFRGKAKCSSCHTGFNLTDESFHNIGVAHAADPGRFTVTGDAKDRGAYKTPTLRDVAATAPYFHDGSATTLLAVVDYYDRGGEANPNLDSKIVKLGLSAQDKRDLVAFMRALSGERPGKTRPRQP